MFPNSSTTTTNANNEAYSSPEEEEEEEEEEVEGRDANDDRENAAEEDNVGEGGEEEEEEEDDPSDRSASSSSSTSSNASPTLHRSASYLLSQTHPFSPPFYNRPPTPLPPSPSLTSLLRPAFTSTVSTPAASRPTTPDDTSDPEPYTLTNDGEVAVAAASARPPIPPATPRVPTYEYYGFVLYLGSSLGFLMYLLWSYLPSPFLHRLGIYYYPNRWWSLAIPAWLVMLVAYIYVALAAYNTRYLTLPLNSVECLVDEQGKIAVLGRDERRRDDEGEEKRRWDWRESVWNRATDAVMDVPVGGLCEILYGVDSEGERGEGWDDELEEQCAAHDE
ncbi:MAG: hypothetical protein M1816_000770 [Peltula sp. TS41687]|nr:MAG: hypothetical protein M1816_000770 [Peltula sp. TS41687]